MSAHEHVWREALDDRERRVLALMAEGMTNLEIAAEARFSEGVVRIAVAHILAVLGARNRTHAVSIGYRTKLLQA